jgi:hypothetical protein
MSKGVISKQGATYPFLFELYDKMAKAKRKGEIWSIDTLEKVAYVSPLFAWEQ